MLDEAQLAATCRFSNISHLRHRLEVLHRGGLEQCNFRDVDPMEVLQRGMATELAMLDAYNRCRLGSEEDPLNARVQDSENIPEMLESFPLRAAVAKRGMNVYAPPIYQLEGTVRDSQQRTEKMNDPLQAPAQVMDARNTVDGNSGATENIQTDFGVSNYNKLSGAPSPWLSFPAGNLTMAEILAFIPYSIKSFDVIDRFLYNGAMSTSLAELINRYRTMPNGQIGNNSVYRMMKNSMNSRARKDKTYKNWKVSTHQTIEKPANYDPTSLCVTKFRTPGNRNPCEVNPAILFRDMAAGVKVMPEGYDALDLTRCIQYCLDHNDEDWCYPRDFVELVERLGGPAPVHAEHQDAAALRRLTSAQKLKYATVAGKRIRNREDRLRKQAQMSVDDSETDEADVGLDEYLHAVGLQYVYTAALGWGKKRYRPAEKDEEADQQVSGRSASKRPRTSTPVSRARSTEPVLSPLREQGFPQDLEDSDDDLYAEFKNTTTTPCMTRASAGKSQSSGLGNIEPAVDAEDKNEANAQDETNQDKDNEDGNEGEEEENWGESEVIHVTVPLPPYTR